MSGVEPRDRREKALSRLVRDVRNEPVPELDWSRLEQQLLSEVKRTAPAPLKRASSPGAWAALALAAAVALWFGTRSPASTSPVRPNHAQVAAAAVHDGETLAIGSRIETTEREALVVHAAWASWKLSPNSSAVLAGRNERVSVRLDRGSVLSQVVHNPKPETFVVEAAGVRIAVHGTLFRVALTGGRVTVDVQEGTVGVGPLAAAAAFFVKAGSHGDFAADGRSGSIDGRLVGGAEAPAEALKHASPRSAGVPAPGSAAPPIASAEPPSEPSINDIEVGIARVVEATSDCFRRHTQGADGIEITAHTALSLKILDSGAVADLVFQPPLSPAAEECASTSITQVRFAASKHGAKVTRVLELKR